MPLLLHTTIHPLHHIKGDQFHPTRQVASFIQLTDNSSYDVFLLVGLCVLLKMKNVDYIFRIEDPFIKPTQRQNSSKDSSQFFLGKLHSLAFSILTRCSQERNDLSSFFCFFHFILSALFPFLPLFLPRFEVLLNLGSIPLHEIDLHTGSSPYNTIQSYPSLYTSSSPLSLHLSMYSHP